MNIDAEVLIKEAIEARKMAYTPYSHFKVGRSEEHTSELQSR